MKDMYEEILQASSQRDVKLGDSAVEQIIKSTHKSDITEIRLENCNQEPAEDDGYVFRAKNIGGSNERRGRQRLRLGSRYKQHAGRATVTSKNIFGFKKMHTCSLINCSLKGVHLESAHLYSRGAVVRLEMDFSESQEKYSCSAKVVYSNEAQAEHSSKGLQYMIGLKFLNISRDYKDFILKKGISQKFKEYVNRCHN